MASLDFCPLVFQLAWLFSSPTCSVRVQLLAVCKPRASREFQPRVSASLHCLEHFFTLSHTLPLHDSHLNTGFLSAVLQENFSRNKANTWLIKFNLTSMTRRGWLLSQSSCKCIALPNGLEICKTLLFHVIESLTPKTLWSWGNSVLTAILSILLSIVLVLELRWTGLLAVCKVEFNQPCVGFIPCQICL